MTPTGKAAAAVMERFVHEHFKAEVTASSGPGTSHFNLRQPWKDYVRGFWVEPLEQFAKGNPEVKENALVQRHLRDNAGPWCICLLFKQELPPELERQIPDEYEGMLVLGGVVERHRH